MGNQQRTGGEKAIGDVSVKGHHLSSGGGGGDRQVAEKALTFLNHIITDICSVFMDVAPERVIFDIILTMRSSTRVSIS